MKFLFDDQYLKGQPQLVERALTSASTTLVTLTESEGPASTPMQVGWAGLIRRCSTGWTRPSPRDRPRRRWSTRNPTFDVD